MRHRSRKSEGVELKEGFFARHTVEVARDLVGKVLVVNDDSGRETYTRILETEAYRGEDPASHSSRGLTPRTAPMFEAPGRAYVYFIYGMYEMLNVTTEPEGYPGAVLIRALERLGDFGASSDALPRLDGPGKLTRALGITRGDNRKPFWGERFRITDDGVCPPAIAVTPRVGIRVGLDEPWRFFWKGHAGVSKVKENDQVLRVIRVL